MATTGIIAPPEDIYKSTTGDALNTGIIAPQTITNVDAAAPASWPTTISSTPYEASADSTVSEQLNRLIGKNSPYIQLSRNNAMNQAAASGMPTKSALAAGYGEKAAIEAALPIAQQDAGFRQDLDKTRQQGLINADLARVQGGVSSQLAGEEFGYQKQLNDQTIQANKELQTQIDAAQNYRQKVERKTQLLLKDMDLTVNQQLATMEYLAQVGQQYQADYAGILNSSEYKNEESRNKALENVSKSYESNVNLLTSLAGVTLTWSKPTTTSKPVDGKTDDKTDDKTDEEKPSITGKFDPLDWINKAK